MKFDSPLFDKIRIKPIERNKKQKLKAESPACDWHGCKEPGTHKAPKGRDREGEYWNYCINHVREYNANYNYFSGMKDDAVQQYQKDALTGHRPTWKMGQNGGEKKRGKAGNNPGFTGESWSDPFRIFGGAAGAFEQKGEAPEGRMIRNAERKAFDTLGLEIDATAEALKARYKELVKRHHPDANGGDRSSEDRFRAVVQAYNYLKAQGFC
ncbi:MAG: DnaJ domain-containing protein [Xanthobacteraceae bacterium]|nr:DnaJ domain-containing protein [Xanthobacteraceae bacterium]